MRLENFMDETIGYHGWDQRKKDIIMDGTRWFHGWY